MSEVTAPKLFISYSWSSPEHEAWVLKLATRLMESGIDVRLDKWHLREGQSSIHFMESMVTDPEITKVAIIADRIYMEKSNGKRGGVGTEAQIISPKVYSSQTQDKFVLIASELDAEGKAYTPVYYEGRIHINLSDSAEWEKEFERLIRWVFNKPLHVAPDLGKPPAYITAGPAAISLGTTASADRCIAALQNGRENASGTFIHYLDTFVQNYERFRLVRSTTFHFDDQVWESIASFQPYREEALRVFNAVGQYGGANLPGRLIHTFFERLAAYNFRRPLSGVPFYETDEDNFRFITAQLFLSVVALFLNLKRFDIISNLIGEQYYLPQELTNRSQPMWSFPVLGMHVRSVEIRNQRLQLRRISLQGEKLLEYTNSGPISKSQLCQADFLLYLRGIQDDARWFPSTWIYTHDYWGPFEMFARAASLSRFEEIRPLLGVKDLAAFKELVRKCSARDTFVPSSGFETYAVASLSGIDNLGAKT